MIISLSLSLSLSLTLCLSVCLSVTLSLFLSVSSQIVLLSHHTTFFETSTQFSLFKIDIRWLVGWLVGWFTACQPFLGYFSQFYKQLYGFKQLMIFLMICFGLVWFHGISTLVGYLMPNPIYTYILNIYDLVWLDFMAYQPL